MLLTKEELIFLVDYNDRLSVIDDSLAHGSGASRRLGSHHLDDASPYCPVSADFS
jgi:hypothetical protein